VCGFRGCRRRIIFPTFRRGGTVLNSFAFCACVVCTAHREEYRLLRQINAERVEPVLDAVFTEAQTWDALSVLGVFFPSSAKSGGAL